MQALVLLGFVAQVTRHYVLTNNGGISSDMRRRVSELVLRSLASPSIAVVSRALGFFTMPDGCSLFGPHLPTLRAAVRKVADSHWSPVLRANATAALLLFPSESVPLEDFARSPLDDATTISTFSSLALSSVSPPVSDDVIMSDGIAGLPVCALQLHGFR